MPTPSSTNSRSTTRRRGRDRGPPSFQWLRLEVRYSSTPATRGITACITPGGGGEPKKKGPPRPPRKRGRSKEGNSKLASLIADCAAGSGTPGRDAVIILTNLPGEAFNVRDQ